jgi:hypothetical protein
MATFETAYFVVFRGKSRRFSAFFGGKMRFMSIVAGYGGQRKASAGNEVQFNGR